MFGRGGSGGDGGDSGSALEIAGEYDDNFGGTHVITSKLWNSSGVIEYDNEANVVYLQNPCDAQFSPNLFNKVVYTAGGVASDGGWFASGLKVQVRRSGAWVDVGSTIISPSYPYDSSAGANTYTFTFPDIDGTGVRVAGAPGGSQRFTTVQEVKVFYQ